MFPEINITESIKVYSFGIFLSASILFFLWMIRKVSRAIESKPSYFFDHLLWFFLATFFFARLLHVIFFYGLPGKSSFSWSHAFLSFFTMSDFYFSLAGGVVGFIIVLVWSLKEKEEVEKRKAYDTMTLAFLFAMFFGYIGAFLGGQTYGIESRGALSVDYSLTNPFLGNYPRFPLAIAYTIVVGVIFSFCYMFRKAHKEHGLTAFLGISLFCIMLILGEFWNDSSQDNVSSLYGLLTTWRIININQIGALILLYWAFRHLVMDLDIPVGDTAKKILQIHPPKKIKASLPAGKAQTKKRTVKKKAPVRKKIPAKTATKPETTTKTKK